MNTYKKYCPNVFIAKCEEEHKKDDEIIVTTRHGKENACIVHNFLGSNDGFYYYSITRADGFNSQERAKRKADKIQEWADKAEQRAEEWMDKSNEGKDFLVLAEPIKVGHHSEKRHRALIERNHNRMGNAIKESRKASQHQHKAEYWESLADVIDLSMPESLEYFENQYKKAADYHQKMKKGEIKRAHSYSLTYAKKKVNDLKKKLDTARTLWG